MESILNQSHTKETFFYSLSKMLERAAFYGIRALLVFYMLDEGLKMEKTQVLSIMGLLSLLIIISQVIGAVLGDLVIGNRKAMILGGILQTIGAFSLAIPSLIGLYLGLFFVILGGGLYTPNITSNLGKGYLTKTKLLDAAFAFFYLGINVGSFLGILLIGYIGEEYGWSNGFVMAGILLLLSVISILILKEKKPEQITSSSLSAKGRMVTVSISFLLVALFWTIYEIAGIRVYDLHLGLSEMSTLDIPKNIWTSFNFISIVPISVLAVVLWTYFYSSQLFKLMLGFMFASLSYGILWLIPEIPTEQHTILYFVALFFLSISEVHLTPIIDSILTQYTSPQYLAITISLAFIPTRAFSFIIGLFSEDLYENPSLAILIGMLTMTIFSVVLITYHLTKKGKLPTEI
jgi:POT family proton-dependent oligopeptide transporter